MSLGSLLRSAAVSGRENRPSGLLFADGRLEPVDRGRVHLRVFAPLVCIRRFYFSSSSRRSAVTLYLHGRARGLSQVEIPPRETTTLCLCWFHRTHPVGASCSASDAPHCFLGRGPARRHQMRQLSPPLLSFLSFFFLLALSCVWRLLRFSSQRRQKRQRGNHLKCDKLKGKPPGMNERQRGSIRSSVQSTPVADQRSALNKSPRCRLQRAASSFFFSPPMDDLNRSV